MLAYLIMCVWIKTWGAANCERENIWLRKLNCHQIKRQSIITHFVTGSITLKSIHFVYFVKRTVEEHIFDR